MKNSKKEKLYSTIIHKDYNGLNVSHNDLYTNPLPFEISTNPPNVKLKRKCNLDEDIWKVFDLANLGNLIWGIFSIILILYSLFQMEYNIFLSSFYKIVLMGSCFVLIVCLVSHFLLPRKELILNRKHSTITFPDIYWNKNITISFDKISLIKNEEKNYKISLDTLRIINPQNTSLSYAFSLGNAYSEDMSLLTWYMDKNRPLPPGDAFDPYRQQDFERRKTENFPKPLFPCSFDTPEFTLEQQAERNKIGRW